MEIEDRGLPVFPRDAAQGPARDAVGQQAEVAAATTRQVAAAQAKRGDRHLDEGVPVARPEAEAGGIRHAVVVVADRIDAGAVVVAFLGQHVERPERPAVDREARGAVALDELAAYVLENCLGPADRSEERRVGKEWVRTVRSRWS